MGFEMPQKVLSLIEMSIQYTDVKVKIQHSI